MFERSSFRLQDDHEGVDWAQLEGLYALAGLNGRRGDKLLRAFLNSSAVSYAFDKQMLIGAARAVGDGEYHAVVYDVAVHPDYQRQGIGSMVMKHLLAQVRVWRVMLIASGDVQAFYGQLGFSGYPDAMAKVDWSLLEDPFEGADA